MGKQRTDETIFTCDVCAQEVAQVETGKFPNGWHFAVDQIQSTTSTGVYVGPKCWKRLSDPQELPPGILPVPPEKSREEGTRQGLRSPKPQ